MARFRIFKTDTTLVLEYTPQDGGEWIGRKIEEDGFVNLRRTFFFDVSHLLPSTDDDSPELESYDEPEEIDHDAGPTVQDVVANFESRFGHYRFILGKLDGDYFKIPGSVLGIGQDVYVAKDFPLKPQHFIAPRKVSVFGHIETLVSEDFFIGGSHEAAIPGEVFEEVVGRLPTELELSKYVRARISGVLKDYFEVTGNAERNYENYRNKREKTRKSGWVEGFDKYELQKYTDILARLQFMLDHEEQFTEPQWQVEIKDILCLVFPKYLCSVREAPIFDEHTGTTRSVDFLLIDHDGNIDALEIKKPYGIPVISKRTYRDNFIPMKDLSGAVLQIEKYLYHLVRSGKRGVDAITKKFSQEIPDGMILKVTNPSGLILMGRDKGLSPEQRLDFEVAKRHYRNVVDILTYDDLIRRLGSKIKALS